MTTPQLQPQQQLQPQISRQSNIRRVRRPDIDSVAAWVANAHREWTALITEMCSSADGWRARYAAADHLATLVSRHSFAAVGALYPVLEEQVPWEERALFSALTADLVSASHLLVDLEHLMHGDTHHSASAFPMYARRLRDILTAHVEREEGLLPLVAVMDRPEQDRLFAAVRRAERRAPTRPHPHTLAHHAAVRLGRPVERAIDAVRDALDNRTAS